MHSEVTVTIASQTVGFIEQIKKLLQEKCGSLEKAINKIEVRSFDAPIVKTDILVTDSLEFSDAYADKNAMTNVVFIVSGVDEVQIAKEREFEQKYRNIDVNSLMKATLTQSRIAEILYTTITEVMFDKDSDTNMRKLNKRSKDLETEMNNFRSLVRKFSEVQLGVVKSQLSLLKSFDYAKTYKALKSISGDAVIVKELPGKLFAFIGDVTDHGLFAGAYGVSLVSLASSFFDTAKQRELTVEDWAYYMQDAAYVYKPDGFISEEILQMMTATATFIEIDMIAGIIKILYFGSGGEPAIVIRGDSVEVLESTGPIFPPLGEVSGIRGLTATVSKFSPGDILMLYTDGLTEVFSEGTSTEIKDTQKMFSSKRIVSVLKKVHEDGAQSPQEYLDSIIRETHAFSIDANLDNTSVFPEITDDITILFLKQKEQGKGGI